MKALIAAMTLLMLIAQAVAATPVDDYAATLKKYVDADGLVNYRALADDRAGLDAFTRYLAELDESAPAEWSEADQLALWINAYNALTLRLIVDRYPIGRSKAGDGYPANSIRQIEGAWDKVTFEVTGAPMTLNHIEHGIIRRLFREPRIHFALVCAAVSCPPLRNEPYRGETLEAQLHEQSVAFIRDTKHVAVDYERKVAKFSAIFEWFSGDFDVIDGGSGNGVVDFIARHLDDARAVDWLYGGEYEVEYFHYDWSLNDQGR